MLVFFLCQLLQDMKTVMSDFDSHLLDDDEDMIPQLNKKLLNEFIPGNRYIAQ